MSTSCACAEVHAMRPIQDLRISFLHNTFADLIQMPIPLFDRAAGFLRRTLLSAGARGQVKAGREIAP